jgi:hypothetical protein
VRYIRISSECLPVNFNFYSFVWIKNLEEGQSVHESHFCSRKVGADATFLCKYVILQYPIKISQFLPCNSFLIFVKMRWVHIISYFFSFIKFDIFYNTFRSPLHFTITKTPKKPHNTTDSHHSSRQMHQE